MSNKILNLFLSGSVMLGIAHAAPSNSWRSSVGVEGQYYNYRVPHLMHLVGWRAGVNAETSYHLPTQWFLGLNGRLLGGKTNYGSYNTGRISNESQMLFEARFLFGKEISLASGASLSPYTGLGYRYKADEKMGIKLLQAI